MTKVNVSLAIGRVLFLLLKVEDAVSKIENDLRANDKSITKKRKWAGSEALNFVCNFLFIIILCFPFIYK